ncbi:MAG TPA: GMC family oxidoreductase N-terminal domain-containing protein, partial [Microthrixaceae bacterium]|nr:GMC family oxidoreductase N-terminal domain-containing protein [Microthrixaceae bacterium]
SEFRQTQADLAYLTDIFSLNVGYDLATSQASIVVGGRGLGGGSLVYSMVSLRAPSFVFDDPVWPEAITRAELDPYYARAEEQLGVVQVQWTGNQPDDDFRLASKRDAAFALACENAGVSCDPVPVAVNDQCGNLGWCTTGCIRHGKNSVDLRYLQPAEDLGAELRTAVRVVAVEAGTSVATGGRRWRVLYKPGAGQFGDLLPTTALSVLEADTVVLAAGAVGSPNILLTSAPGLDGGISPQVGRNLSRGGDMLIPVVLPDSFDLDDLEMSPGKIIGSCSFQYLFEPPPGFGPDWQRFIIQPMMVLPVLSALLVADPHGVTAEGGDMRQFGVGQKHLMQKWGSRLLHLGIMGVDGMDGVVSSTAGIPTVSYSLSSATHALYQAARAAARHIIETGNGGQVLPTWDQLNGDSFSIHPLGSCRMASSPDEGGLDSQCRVFRADGTVHDGLYVMDASAMSSPIAVNTSLTTAAIAERASALTFTT